MAGTNPNTPHPADSAPLGGQPSGPRATAVAPSYPASVPPSYPGAVPVYPGAAPSYPAGVPPGGGRSGSPSGGAQGPGIQHYAGIILARWWLVLLCLLLGAGGGFAFIYKATPRFRAQCRIEVFQDPRLNFEENSPRSAMFIAEREIERRSIILRSGLLRAEVMTSLADTYKEKLIPEEEKLTAEERSDVTTTVKAVDKAPTMMDISVDAVKQDYALAYLGELLEKYQAKRRREMESATDIAMRSLKNERESVYESLQEAQGELAKFLSAHSIQVNEAKAEWDERFLASLIQRQNALRMEETMLETQFSMIDELSVGAIEELVNLSLETRRATQGELLLGAGAGGATRDIQAPVAREQADWQVHELELARLEAQYDEKRDVYLEQHPVMLALRSTIDGVKRDLKLTAEMAMKRLEERQKAVAVQEKALQKAIDDWRANLDLTVADRAQYQTLNAKVANLQKLHDAVYSRMLEGSVLKLDPVYQRTIETPVGVGQVWPSPAKVMGFSLALALAIGVALAFMLHHFDTTLLDIAAAENRFGIAYVSGIPHWGRLIKSFSGKSNSIIVTREKTNVATEVYRTVRGTLEHIMGPTDGCFALAITSSDSGDGKSLTALNLAVVFAWTGKRVLLVDGDLRRGALHKALAVESGEGFTELLLSTVADWRQTVKKTPYENMDFISSGQYVQESPEQLGSKRLKELMDEWRSEYDLVVFDTAPVSRVMDTAVLARSCDGVLLVARFGKTRLAELQHLLRRLEGTRVLGFCINCIDFQKLSKSYYGYSGYYGYGYRDYGYGYYRYYSYYQPYGSDKKKAEPPAKA